MDSVQAELDRVDKVLLLAPYDSQHTADTISWTSRIFGILVHLLSTLFDYVGRLSLRISKLEERYPNPGSGTSSPIPEETPISRPPLSSDRKPGRCDKCHARRHSSEECRTKDGKAMRKRVAQNQRRRKASRDVHQLPPSSYAAPWSAPPLPSLPSMAATSSINISALVADATELRRRSQQSSRDKKRAQRSAHPQPS